MKRRGGAGTAGSERGAVEALRHGRGCYHFSEDSGGLSAQALRYGAMERCAVKNARNIGGNAAMSSYAHQRCAGGRFFIRMTILLKESRDV